VQLIDDYHQNRKLGVVFEAKLGKGKLLVSSINTENNFDESAVVSQFRKSLLKYMQSHSFDPKVRITKINLQKLLNE
jgi:beta-galactosidase